MTRTDVVQVQTSASSASSRWQGTLDSELTS